jgi:hypothetical protein
MTSFGIVDMNCALHIRRHILAMGLIDYSGSLIAHCLGFYRAADKISEGEYSQTLFARRTVLCQLGKNIQHNLIS